MPWQVAGCGLRVGRKVHRLACHSSLTTRNPQPATVAPQNILGIPWR